MPWRKVFKILVVILFLGTGMYFAPIWQPQPGTPLPPLPMPRPVFIGFATLHALAWWDKPLARGLFGGIAAMEAIGLVAPGLPALITLVVVGVLLARWKPRQALA